MDFKSMTEAEDKLLLELKPMHRPIATNTSEFDNNLVSFRDAFSPLLTTQQAGEALPCGVVPCGEGRPLDCSATISSQWSPSKVVNPSQIFTPIRNPKSSQNRDRRRLPHSPGAYQYKYRIGFGATTDPAQTDFLNRNTDSDYFSSNGSGSPRCDYTDANAVTNIKNSNCIISNNNSNNNTNNSLPIDQIGFNPEKGQYHLAARNLISSTQFLQMYSLPQYQPTIKNQHLMSNYVDLWKTSQPGVEQRQLPFDMWQPKTIPCYFPLPANTAVRLSSIEKSMNISGRAFSRQQGYTSNRSFGTWGYVPPYTATAPKPCYIGYPISSQEKPLTYPAEVLKQTQAQLPTKIKMEEPSPKANAKRQKMSQSKERLRERSIREKLKTLTEILPYEVCKNSRPSRTMILEKAVEYITSLEEDIKLLEKKLGMKIRCEFSMDANEDSPADSDFSNEVTNDLASSRGQRIDETLRCRSMQTKNTVAPSRTTCEPSPVARSYIINHVTYASNENSLEQQRQLPSSIVHHALNTDHRDISQHGLSMNSDQQHIRSHLVHGVGAKKFVVPFQGVQSSTLNHSHAAQIGLEVHQKRYNGDFIPFKNNPVVKNCHENSASSNWNIPSTDKAVAHVKRPMNPFMVFSKQHRSRIMAANPGVDNRTVSRLLGKEWGELPIEEKLPYRNQFKLQLHHLKTQYPEWNYNSYKARMNRAKRNYDRTSKSAVQEDGIAAKKSKTNEIKLTLNKTNSTREKDSRHEIVSPEAKVKESERKDYAAQWRSWLQGGPYYSSAITK